MKFILSILLIISFNTQSFSQETIEQKSKILFSLGSGVNFTENSVLIPIQLNIGKSINGNLFFARFAYQSEIVQLEMSPKEYVTEFGLLYGLYLDERQGRLSISGGLGFVNGLKRDKLLYKTGGFLSEEHYSEKNFSTIGIPLEIKFEFNPFGGLGIGICANANLNREYSTFGAILQLSAF